MNTKAKPRGRSCRVLTRYVPAFVADMLRAPAAICELFLSPEALVRRSKREVTP